MSVHLRNAKALAGELQRLRDQFSIFTKRTEKLETENADLRKRLAAIEQKVLVLGFNGGATQR